MADNDKDGGNSEFDELFDEQKGPKEDDVHRNKGKPKPDGSDGAKKPEESQKEDLSWHDDDDVEKIKKLCDELNAANKKLSEANDKARRLEVDNANISAINRLLSEAKDRQDKLLAKLIPANFALAHLLNEMRADAADLLKRCLRLQSENEALAADQRNALAMANYERGQRINARAAWGFAWFVAGAAFASLLIWFFAIRT